ncbi:biopolymer transporter ExbD [Verrucomicrobiaceae bacterium N1E253]|uniref:Biopolymer transporter ExbD n=1 Tax=Oceaniferula marina TaxID=2748318 RepID=A0A851GPB5_9BACT|nr:biopolymer transporter ExbD [Oceaniferula marina]NWK56670.1 biopolymer transporter ExbD [Oceaniferula marina]
MRISDQDEEEFEVSLSPLIDCVFLLLIFFLLTTMLKKDNRDISIDLPVSTSALELAADDKNTVIGLNAVGEVHIDGVPSDLNDLRVVLKDIYMMNGPDHQIRLDADTECPAFRVVEVLDICQFIGMRNLAVRTYDEFYNQ